MNMKYCSTLTLAAMLGVASLQAATVVSVYMKNGTKSDLQLQDNGKMTVAGDELGIQVEPTAKITVFPMADIRKVTFSSATTGVAQNAAEKDIVVFPNPVQDRMFLSNVEKGAQLSIYNLQGVLVAEMTYSEEGVDVSSLPAGSYLLSVNGVSVKVNKL